MAAVLVTQANLAVAIAQIEHQRRQLRVEFEQRRRGAGPVEFVALRRLRLGQVNQAGNAGDGLHVQGIRCFLLHVVRHVFNHQR